MIHCLHEKFLLLLSLSSQGYSDDMHYMHVIVWFLLRNSPPSPLRCHDRRVSWNEPQPYKSDALSASQPSIVTVYCILPWQHRHFTHHEILWFSPSHCITLLFPSSLSLFIIKFCLSQFFIYLLFAQITTFFRLQFIILFRFLSFLVLFLPFYLSFTPISVSPSSLSVYIHT